MFKNVAHKKKKKKGGAKNEAGGDEKHLFFLLGLIFRTKIVELICYIVNFRNIPLKRE